MKRKKNTIRKGCPKPNLQDKEDLTLSTLVDIYLTEKHAWKKMPEKVGTDKELLELYLDSLEDLTDYICGENTKEKVPEGTHYVLNGHQKRPLNGKYEVINSMGKKLKELEGKKFDTFESLIEEVEKRKEKWFGPTAIYDFALRFGWHQNPRIEPKEYVYVHSIPAQSANRLRELGYLKTVSRKIPFSNFPKEMRKEGMTAKDVENFLCIFAEEINKLKK